MENIETSRTPENHLHVNDQVKKYLLETAKWGKFLAIVGFVGMGLLVLLGLAFIVGFSIFNSLTKSPVPVGALGFIYIIMAVLYFFPLNYLYNFSEKIPRGIALNDELELTSSFENLKSLFKFSGILTIVLLSLYALILVIAVPLIFIMGHS
jgi:hypothetical protein